MNEIEANQVLDDYLKLPEVFQYYGIEIRSNGFCNCPFHSERTGSCKVNDRVYHCFGCGAKGNAVSFVKEWFQLDFKTAIQKLNYDFGLNLLDAELTPEQKAKIKKRKQIEYQKKQEDKELAELKEEYETAWKHYLYYKPKEPHFNENTPEYEVNEWWASVDKRYWRAKETLQRLTDLAKIYGFYMEECDAVWKFLEPTQDHPYDPALKEWITAIIKENEKQIQAERLKKMI